jgi:hypothetical protein
MKYRIILKNNIKDSISVTIDAHKYKIGNNLVMLNDKGEIIFESPCENISQWHVVKENKKKWYEFWK